MRSPTGRPPAVGPGGLPDFLAHMRRTNYRDVELDDRWEVLPDDMYIECDVKSVHYGRNPFNDDPGLQLRLVVTFPEEYKGVGLKDSVTIPDEMLHGGDEDRFNKLRKRMKMFLDACELMGENGEFSGESPNDFVGQIVGCKTRNNTNESTGKTYTNVGFSYWRAEKTPGLQPSGPTVSVPDVKWKPQG